MIYINFYKKLFTWIGKTLLKVIKFQINLVIKVIKTVFDVFTNPGKYIDKAKEGLSKLGANTSALMGDVRAWFSRTIGKAFEWLTDQFYAFGDFISDIVDHPFDYITTDSAKIAHRNERLQGMSAIRKIKDLDKLRSIGLTDPQIQELKNLKEDSSKQSEALLRFLKTQKVNSSKFLNDPISYLNGDKSTSKGGANG